MTSHINIYSISSLRQISSDVLHRRRSHEPAAVCPECGCTFWCRALDVTTASRQCYRWISSWPLWSICHCPAGLQPIWPPTVSWSPTKDVSCVLPHRGRALCDEPTATMMTAAGVKLWNSLPDDLHQADIERSKRLMKTFLFGC